MNCFKALQACKNCPLSEVRRNVITGSGALPAPLLIIGEAPGKEEDILGLSYVGKDSRVLDTMLSNAGIDSGNVYKTYAVLCSPSDKFGGEVREPKPEEVLACMSNILKICSKVNPRWVLLLGDIPFKYYGKHFTTAFHIASPASLLRTGGILSPYYIRNIRTLQILSERMKTNVSKIT